MNLSSAECDQSMAKKLKAFLRTKSALYRDNKVLLNISIAIITKSIMIYSCIDFIAPTLIDTGQ